MTAAAAETVELLARRTELLRTLASSPRAKRDLVEALPISRSTVDRAVRNLEAKELVERNEQIALTLRGRLAIEAYNEFVGYVDELEAARPILASLPRDTTVDRCLFEGATFVSPDRLTPQRHAVAFLDEIEAATEIRGFSTAFVPTYVDLLHERILEDGLTVELTLPADLLEELFSSAQDRIDEALATGRLTFLEASTTLEYSLFVLEQPERTLVAALVYDDQGRSGIVFNDSPAAVAWAERRYEAIRDAADRLSA
jgi:predicted transcriptional regulator